RSCGRESPVRRAAWRQWSIENGYDDPVDIPSASVREHVSHDGLLRDPQVDAIALRYWRFCSEQIADTILVFGRSAQERIQKRVPLGAFYGYILEHAQGRLVSEGHLSGHRLL